MSHYIMLVVDPAAPMPTSCIHRGRGRGRGKRFLGTVYHIDSRSGYDVLLLMVINSCPCCRGPIYARRMHPVWRRCEVQLRTGIFGQCRWLNVVQEDLQVSGGLGSALVYVVVELCPAFYCMALCMYIFMYVQPVSGGSLLPNLVASHSCGTLAAEASEDKGDP